jgi:hypothetical protein
MKVSHERLVGPEYMIPVLRVTTGKDMKTKKMPSLELWYKMILSEHSSHRAVKYRIMVEDMPYYAHVHLVRHHVGVEPHVFSQRDDGGIETVTERDGLPQGACVNMIIDLNVQSIINIARQRLCFKAHKVLRNFVSELKKSLQKSDDYDKILSRLLLRPCEWYKGFCKEPTPCGRVKGVTNLYDVHKGVLKDLI